MDSLTGTVTEFSEEQGLGTITSATGVSYRFHLIEIADGTRTIDVGQSVTFQPLPKFGTLQARRIHKPDGAVPRSRSGRQTGGSGSPKPDHSEVRERRIIDVLITLQPGEVVTYGDIAEMAGYPRASRLVGRILATTDVEVPWWRVVNVVGRLVPGNETVQTELLQDEDVIIRNGKVKSAPYGRFGDV